MRLISDFELDMISGGLGTPWKIIEFNSDRSEFDSGSDCGGGGGGEGGGGGSMQVVEIVGQRMSDFEKAVYDVKTQENSCFNGIVGGVVAGSPGGAWGMAAGALGGAIAGGCFK